MNSARFLPVFLLAISVFSWNAFPRRIAQDVAEWKITRQQGRRYIFMYRSWSVAFAFTGVFLVYLTLTGK